MEQKEGTRKKRTVFAALFVLAIGFLPLLNSLDNPRLAALHGVDIVRLVAAGFCFGTAFGMLMSARTSSTTSSK